MIQNIIFESVMAAQKYKILFVLIAFTTFSSEIFAQKMNLEECISHALENNIQLKQAEINTQITDYNAKNNKYNLLPSVNGNAGWSNNFGRSVDPFTNQFINANVVSYSFSLNSQVTLFNGMSKVNTMRQSAIDYEKSVLDYEKSKNDMVLAVASSYLQILMAKENLTRSELQLENSNQQFDRIQKQFDAGAVPITNLLEIKTQVANDEFNKVTAENQLVIAKLTLAQLLDINESNFDIVDPSLNIDNVSIQNYDETQVFESAQQTLPEVKSAELGVESSLKGLQISRGRYTPTLTLGAVVFTGTSSTAPNPNYDEYTISGYNLDTTLSFTESGERIITPSPILIAPDYTFSNQLKDNIRQQVSLNLSIPIFNGMSSRYQVQRSKLNHQIAVLNEQNTKNQLRKDVQKANTDYNAAAKRYQSAKNQLEVAEENYKNAKIRFEQGLISTVDYRTITNTRNSAQSDMMNAKYDFVFKQKILDFYQGKEIKL